MTTTPQTVIHVGVALVEGTVTLTLAAADEARVLLPVTPEFARWLASQLLGAAKAADPAGHTAILDELAKFVQAHDALISMDFDEQGPRRH